MVSKGKGNAGEETAVRYLEGKGYSIVARNWRGRRGEVDIIARDAENLVFVEVKAYAGLELDSLERMINRTKQRKIISAAQEFLLRQPEYGGMRIRSDVVFVTKDGAGECKITHLDSAFGESV
jgi:putative endonuclease